MEFHYCHYLPFCKSSKNTFQNWCYNLVERCPLSDCQSVIGRVDMSDESDADLSMMPNLKVFDISCDNTASPCKF